VYSVIYRVSSIEKINSDGVICSQVDERTIEVKLDVYNFDTLLAFKRQRRHLCATNVSENHHNIPTGVQCTEEAIGAFYRSIHTGTVQYFAVVQERSKPNPNPICHRRKQANQMHI